MPLNDAGLALKQNAFRTGATHMAPFPATPNATGSNASAAARRPIPWATTTNGALTTSAGTAFTGMPANEAVVAIGFFSAATGGTFYGYHLVTSGDQQANAAGEYTVSSVSDNLTVT